MKQYDKHEASAMKNWTSTVFEVFHPPFAFVLVCLLLFSCSRNRGFQFLFNIFFNKRFLVVKSSRLYLPFQPVTRLLVLELVESYFIFILVQIIEYD